MENRDNGSHDPLGSAEVPQFLVVYARYNENFVLVVTSGCCIRWDSTGYQGGSPWLVSGFLQLIHHLTFTFFRRPKT
jgi:hypothetical protein